jgi:hypothetical protein
VNRTFGLQGTASSTVKKYSQVIREEQVEDKELEGRLTAILRSAVVPIGIGGLVEEMTGLAESQVLPPDLKTIDLVT